MREQLNLKQLVTPMLSATTTALVHAKRVDLSVAVGDIVGGFIILSGSAKQRRSLRRRDGTDHEIGTTEPFIFAIRSIFRIRKPP